MPVVDAHTHVYPDSIASRAVQGVLGFYGMEHEVSDRGTLESLLAVADSSPITHMIVYPVALRERTVQGINDFAAAIQKEHPEKLVCFMAMHQDFQDMAEEVERACDLGLKGIKIHPDTQGVNADDPRLMQLYEIAQAKGLPVAIHAGDYRYDFSHPRRIRSILKSFPQLRVNAAHFGGWSLFDVGADILAGENCFVDVSSSIRFMGPRHARELINLYGSDFVMFGSDFPMWDPAQSYRELEELKLPDDVMEKVTWKNAQRFLGFELAQ